MLERNQKTNLLHVILYRQNRKKHLMENISIDENIFRTDDIKLLNGSEELFNTPCVVIQNTDYTPLQASIIHNSINIRDFLLKQKNINVNIQNSKGENVLITAIINKTPLNFVKELFRRNVDICLPKDSKYSSVIGFADPEWEGYSELKHILQRRKSYQFIYKKQNSEKQIEIKSNGIERLSDNLNDRQNYNELMEIHEKNHVITNPYIGLSTLNNVSSDHTNSHSAVNHSEVVECKDLSEPINQELNRKGAHRIISKSILIPKDVIKPSMQFYSKEKKKRIDQIENMCESISIDHEPEVFVKVLETEKDEEYKEWVYNSHGFTLNDEEHNEKNINCETSNYSFSDVVPEKNTLREPVTKDQIKNEDNVVHQLNEDSRKYFGVDDEYVLFIGHQLNESFEASRNFFTCTFCAGIRPWKSEYK